MKNKVFNILAKTGLPWLLRRSKGRAVTILCFHRVSEARDLFFDPLSPATFEELIKYCIKNYHITSFSGLNERSAKPKLILSFDDGYHDFMEYAIPVLAKYDLPSNHNLVNTCLSNNTVIWTQRLNDIFTHLKNNNITDDDAVNEKAGRFNDNWTGYNASFFQALLKLKKVERDGIVESLAAKYGVVSKYKMMNWEDAKLCMEKYRVEIGCHTYNHDNLATLNTADELDAEIGLSITEMENKLGNKINVLAFPNGRYNPNVLEYLEKKGIRYALLLDEKVNSADKLKNNSNLVSRINIGNEPISQTILRAEGFHSKLKKIA